MNKHSPGPWKTSDTAGHETHGQSAVHDSTGKDIAIVYDGARNARLIAAAPEMLAFIKACLDTKGGDELEDFVANNAESVIAAAEGTK